MSCCSRHHCACKSDFFAHSAPSWQTHEGGGSKTHMAHAKASGKQFAAFATQDDGVKAMNWANLGFHTEISHCGAKKLIDMAHLNGLSRHSNCKKAR